jgi:membrane protein DedA with SNARE-associated domain
VSLWTQETIALLGYGGVALAMLIEDIVVPIPSEVIMPAAGFVAARYGLSLWGIVLAGTAGSLVGGLPWYYLGRRMAGGEMPAWLQRRGSVDKAQEWFARHGREAVLLARLLPGVRSLIGIPAGLARMPLAPFLLYSAVGTLAWTGALAYAGSLLGAELPRLARVLGPVVWVILALAGVTWWLLRREPHGPRRFPPV